MLIAYIYFEFIIIMIYLVIFLGGNLFLLQGDQTPIKTTTPFSSLFILRVFDHIYLVSLLWWEFY